MLRLLSRVLGALRGIFSGLCALGICAFLGGLFAGLAFSPCLGLLRALGLALLHSLVVGVFLLLALLERQRGLHLCGAGIAGAGGVGVGGVAVGADAAVDLRMGTRAAQAGQHQGGGSHHASLAGLMG